MALCWKLYWCFLWCYEPSFYSERWNVCESTTVTWFRWYWRRLNRSNSKDSNRWKRSTTKMLEKLTKSMWFSFCLCRSVKIAFIFSQCKRKRELFNDWYMGPKPQGRWCLTYVWLYRSALAVNCWVINHALEVSSKEDYIISGTVNEKQFGHYRH